jgi:hypothetical protein
MFKKTKSGIANGIEVIHYSKISVFLNNLSFKACKFWSYILPKLEKPYAIIHWLFWKIVFYLTVAFVMLGIALVIGFYSGIITFNQRLVTNDAVILYRSKLPAKLTKAEAKEWAQIKVLQKKLNKKTVIYQISQDKKLFPKKR